MEKIILWFCAIFFGIIAMDQATKYADMTKKRDDLQAIIDSGEHCEAVCADMFYDIAY